ncbi:MAG: hypothetical protein AAGE52_07455 [Myxococcota bacterium]
MRELGLVFGVFLIGGGVAATTAGITRFGGLEVGWLSMIAVGAASVVCEVIYFGLLYVALRAGGSVPARWYARSFEHHHLLTRGQRFYVLPFFVVGGIGLVVALLLALALVFAGYQTLSS